MEQGEIPNGEFGSDGTVFWQAAGAGRFILPKCTDCGKVHWYPRAVCPFCLSSEIGWQESRGLGHVYASTLFRKTDAPYVIAYVELDEGPRMLTKIVSADLAPVYIGQRVEVHFLTDDTVNGSYPVFRPIGTT
ncbi:Zn-ribbon domain-containing OB-fold protein [Rhizobium leguminosarum]|uniref:Zn-ribbon domain-containing OB-fold protein n=1 Tax=Rhizobium leguminosarum TaxID=384 RepID=UPI0024B3B6A6|nr:OB-fold domain-containing protein [Rhizobium leguminosarum]WHO82730.1 OB-fold domain-containing protein [Rhizobium leguminosarum]